MKAVEVKKCGTYWVVKLWDKKKCGLQSCFFKLCTHVSWTDIIMHSILHKSIKSFVQMYMFVHACIFSFLKQFVLITLFCQVSRAVFPKEATSHCILWQFYLTAMSSIARTAILKQKSQQNAVDTPSILPTSHDTAYTSKPIKLWGGVYYLK